jgi:PAS domain S-box-containing protein
MYLKKELYSLIKTNESIFDFIQESALDGLWYWDLEDPENEWMNAKFWTVLGYNPDEMPHNSNAWQGIINQEDLKLASDNLTRHCENPNHPYDQIVRYTHKNGSTIWIRCRGMAIRDADGKPIRMLGAHQDVSDIKNREQELIKAKEKAEQGEKRFCSTIEKSPIPSIVAEKDGTIICLNKQFSKTYGYSIQEIPSMEQLFEKAFPDHTYRNFVVDDWKIEVEQSIRINDPTAVKEYLVTSKSGEVKTVVISACFEKDIIVFHFQDITEARRAEEVLHDNELKYRTLYENANDAIMLFFDDRWIDCNHAAEKIFGCSREHLLGAHPKQFSPLKQPDGSDSTEEVIKIIKLAYAKQPQFFRWTHLRLDGTQFLAEVSLNRVDLAGKPHIQAVIRDITEQKLTEDITRVRLSLIQYAQNHSLKELLQKTLDELEVLTQSSIGFYHFVSGDAKLIELKAWSTRTSQEFCKIIGRMGHQYPVDQAGVWADSLREKRPIIHNDYQSLATRKGLPDGHAVVKRELVVPVIRGNRVAALLGIGNKPAEYSQKDIDLVSNFAEFTWEIVANKLAEEEILRFKTIADSAVYSQAIANTEGKLVYVNKHFAHSHGYKPEELIGLNISALHTQKQFETVHSTISLMIQNGYFESTEIWHIHKDGREFPMLMNGIVLNDDKGNPEYIATSAIDITERKHEEDKIRKLSQAVEQSAASIVITDLDGSIEYVNPKFSQITGYTLDEAVRQNPRVLKSGEHNAEYYTELWKTISSGKEWRGEFLNKKKNGELFWESASISPIANNEGNITNYLAVKEDITQQKKAEQELIAAKEKAEESDRLKSAFLANMSHEIRTPMNGILGFAELLKEPGLTGETQQDYIKIIEKSGHRMLNIINDIVDVSKIEAGLMELHIQNKNINQHIEDIYWFFKPEAEAKKVKLSFLKTLSAKEATINTDHKKVYAILMNLVKNAIKFTHQGSIELGYGFRGASSRNPAKIVSEVGERSRNPELEFYVKDTGIGIPKDRQEAIFERFIQADIEDRMAYQGAGLGLSISKAYVEMLGGKIWVESEVGKGSTFYFTLPYPVEPTPEIIDRKLILSKNDSDIKNLKILIVEDDPASEMLIDTLIKSFGKEILKARTGIEAVEVCRNNPDIDLILMDIRMPEMGGREATNLIREFNKEVIIIAQTAYALLGDREILIGAGCNDYISKPIKQATLQALINKYFGT